MIRLLITAVATSVLAACSTTSSSTLTQPPDTTPPPLVAPTPPPSAPSTTPSPDEVAPETCDDVMRAEVEGVVAGQLAAMAAADWSTALGFATDGFRESVDAPGLAAIIEDGFPVVAANTSHEVGGCSRAGPVGQALVVVESAGGSSELVYLLELEPDGWRIGGAVPHGAGGDEPTISA